MGRRSANIRFSSLVGSAMLPVPRRAVCSRARRPDRPSHHAWNEAPDPLLARTFSTVGVLGALSDRPGIAAAGELPSVRLPSPDRSLPNLALQAGDNTWTCDCGDRRIRRQGRRPRPAAAKRGATGRTDAHRSACMNASTAVVGTDPWTSAAAPGRDDWQRLCGPLQRER